MNGKFQINYVEREREVLIELDDFDDCIEEKVDADFLLD